MKKRGVLYILWAISIAISFYLIQENKKNTEVYKEYYDYSAEQIISGNLRYTSKDRGGIHLKGESINSTNSVSASVGGLSGVKDIGEVQFETSEVEIRGNIRSGKLKVLVTDMEDKVVLYEEMGDEEIVVSLPNKQCKIKLVGEDASADFVMTTQNIFQLSGTVDYTDLSLKEILKNEYDMVSLSDLFIYLNEDTLYMDYYFNRQVSEVQREKIIKYNEDYAVLGKASTEDIPYKDVFKLGETDVPWKTVRVELLESVNSVTYTKKPDTIMIYSNIDRKAGTYDLITESGR